MSAAATVFMIRGAPCVGKSSLGRGLRRVLGGGAVVEVDEVRRMLVEVDWKDRRQHDIAMRGALHLLRAYAADGVRPLFLIDTFSRNRIMTVQAWLDGASIGHHTFSLWLDPRALQQRINERVEGFREWEPTRILNDEARLNRYPAETFVDATGLDHAALLARVHREVEALLGHGRDAP